MTVGASSVCLLLAVAVEPLLLQGKLWSIIFKGSHCSRQGFPPLHKVNWLKSRGWYKLLDISGLTTDRVTRLTDASTQQIASSYCVNVTQDLQQDVSWHLSAYLSECHACCRLCRLAACHSYMEASMGGGLKIGNFPLFPPSTTKYSYPFKSMRPKRHRQQDSDLDQPMDLKVVEDHTQPGTVSPSQDPGSLPPQYRPSSQTMFNLEGILTGTNWWPQNSSKAGPRL